VNDVNAAEITAVARARVLGHEIGDFAAVRPGLRVSRCNKCGTAAFATDAGTCFGPALARPCRGPASKTLVALGE
jgi:hypothetical protein